MSDAALKRIFMHLARTKEFPNGSTDHAYEMIAPLDGTDHIDADAWHKHRDACRVKRIWDGEEEDLGHLVRKPGGSWAFHYDIKGEEEDEAGYRFQSHAFREREYISLRDQDGELQPFVISRIEDL